MFFLSDLLNELTFSLDRTVEWINKVISGGSLQRIFRVNELSVNRNMLRTVEIRVFPLSMTSKFNTGTLRIIIITR